MVQSDNQTREGDGPAIPLGTEADRSRRGADILTLPGLDNSGPRHWQSHWETLACCRRVDLGDWAHPRLHLWVDALDAAILASPRPVVLAGHSLGALTIVWWTQLRWREALRGKVAGALLVAPPDVDALESTPRIRDFRPLPRLRLPFPAILVASRNDDYAGFARSEEMAAAWGAELIDLGPAGHINAESGLEEWTRGFRLAAELGGHNVNMLVAELGMRRALA